MSGRGSRRPGPGQGSGRGAGGGLVAGDMITQGSAGGRSVLVWEGPAALKEAGAQVGADRWCDTVGPVVVSYHTGGPSRSSRVLPGEMTRQLDGQFKALSLMSAKEILAGMTTFDERKRSPASHTAIRSIFRDKLAKDLSDRHGFAEDVAGALARRAMKELAVWTAGGFSDSACLCFRLPSSGPGNRVQPRRECDTLGLSEDGHDCISARSTRQYR